MTAAIVCGVCFPFVRCQIFSDLYFNFTSVLLTVTSKLQVAGFPTTFMALASKLIPGTLMSQLLRSGSYSYSL